MFTLIIALMCCYLIYGAFQICWLVLSSIFSLFGLDILSDFDDEW